MPDYLPLPAVQLTEDEKTLLGRISFELGRKPDDEVRIILDAAGQLTESLRKRRVIPEVRVRYFTDPEMNVGSKKSRKQVFESNGTTGVKIFRNASFLKHLRYFIHGPNLPASSIDGFCRILTDDVGTSGMVLDQLRKFVREEVRKHGLDRSDAAEEFFKLAHEVGADPFQAREVRDAARTTR